MVFPGKLEFCAHDINKLIFVCGLRKRPGSSVLPISFDRFLICQNLSFAVKMLADTILILFISMATALLSEGKYLLSIKSEIRLLGIHFSAYYLMRHVLIGKNHAWS